MIPRGRIQAVTLDVGGTLIDPWPSVGHVYAEIAAQHGVEDANPEQLNRQFAKAWRTKANFDYSRAAWSEIVAKTFCATGGSCSTVSFFSELYERFATPDVWRIYDDVVPALEKLRQRGIKLGVISNWDERLRPLLGRLKLDGFFDPIVVSGEVGAHKPDPQIFSNAVQKLQLRAELVLHVGDSLNEDVEGARKAGLRAVKLCRGAKSIGSGEIRSLADLLAIV